MHNKHEFDIEMEKLRQEQVTMLPDYLANFIKNNYNASEMPLFDDNIKASEEIIAAVDIPQHGRDFKEVLDELVEHVLKHTMTIRHPRFFSFVTSTALPYSLAGSVLTDITTPMAAGINWRLCAARLRKSWSNGWALLPVIPKTAAAVCLPPAAPCPTLPV